MLRVRSTMIPSSPLASSHLAIEAHLSDLVVALDGGCTPAQAASLWTEFDRRLIEHFDIEERTLLTDFLANRPREARVILEEHRYLRGRLAQLRASLATISAETARTFLDELSAHSHHEDKVLYRWAESRASAPPREPA
jgi:hypothetical protein